MCSMPLPRVGPLASHAAHLSHCPQHHAYTKVEPLATFGVCGCCVPSEHRHRHHLIMSSSPRPSSVAICADSKRSTGNPASSHSHLTHGALHPSPVHGADRALAGALGQAGAWAAAAYDQVLPVAWGAVRSGVPHALRLQAAACWASERPRDCSRRARGWAAGIAADAWQMLCGPTPHGALLRMPGGVHGRCG